MDFKMKKGFSLVEMMVVMLLIAVVLAASAPMITKKVSRERSDRVFDALSSDPTNAVEYIKGRGQRIFMNGRTDGYVGIVESGVTIPANSVLFGKNTFAPFGDTPAAQFVGIGFDTLNWPGSVAIGYKAQSKADSVAVGRFASTGANNGVAIGYNALTKTFQGTAIGYNASAKAQNSIAIGVNATTGYRRSSYTATNSVVIGYGASTTPGANNAVVIGTNAKASYKNSVAIGNNAVADKENVIVLGTEDTTVYIPGSLVVDHSALIGRAGNRNDNLYFRPYAQEDGRHFAVLNAGDWKGEDSNLSMVQDARNDDRLVVEVGPYSTAEEWWRGDYKDNNRTRVHFTDPNQGDGPNKSHKHSDIRLKNVGEAFTAGLNELEKLNFYHYTYKKDKDKVPQVGVMAQDLQKVFPDAVSKDDGGWLVIRWDEMFYAALNAIKELNAKVCAIAKDVATLKTTTDEHTQALEAQAKTIEEQQAEIKALTERVEKLEHKKK